MEYYQDMNQIYQRYIEELTKVELTSEQKDDMLSHKLPLISFADIQLDRIKVLSALDETCAIINRHRPAVKAEIELIQTKLKVKGFKLRALLDKFVWQDNRYMTNFAEKWHLNLELLLLILFNTVKPFVISYAKAIKEQFPFESWSYNFCPVCGWKPLLASDKEDNSGRLLHCSLCETVWKYKSGQCVHCMNDDHKRLVYLTVENDDIFTINACKQCKGYIKSLREGKLITKDNLAITDVKTIYLDILANKQGYTKDVDVVTSEEIN